MSGIYSGPTRVRFSESKIVKNIEEVLKRRDTSCLSDAAYCFITQHCGSAPAVIPEIWIRRYSDVREFINLFLKENELGQNISRDLQNQNGSDNVSRIKRGIVDLCLRYKNEVFADLDSKERNLSRKIATDLMNGSLKLKDLSKQLVMSTLANVRSFAVRNDAGSDSGRTASIREIVESLNDLAEKYDYKRIPAIFNAFPVETIIAGNYVNAKYRYAVQAVIANALIESMRR
ncbi:MAG: hypothetical protein JRN52_06775 [Nitrososphaerota archaeon]|nr:hypothetical protein [Nitrososphaerota archaeon]